MIADANAETMTVDAAAKEIAVDVTITQEAAVETTTQTTMDVTADRISVRNPDLSRDLLCSIRMQAADVRNRRITVATVNKKYDN